ncbi:putative ATPase [Williamsia muralis]|uniref:Putative ATPase n=1 Tax=Williamsia marianensis TaxID=85044 RepID=A0A495K0Z6_WILMA|nr:putative ATPase [Williamsia muralis]
MPSVTVAPIIGLLGPVAVVDENGQMRPVQGIRARRLLAVLALMPGTHRSQSALIDGVWGDDLPRSPQSALHTQISRLRPQLPDGAIEVGPRGYRLTLSADAIDVFVARSLVAEGSTQALDTAAALWRGDPGEDLGDDDLARTLRQTADRVHDDIVAHRSRKALEDDDFELARSLAQQRCDADPLDESAHTTVIRALAALGRDAEALAVFARIRRSLSAELGADPGPELAALHQQLVSRQGTTPSPARRAAPVRAVGLSAEPNELFGRAADVARICRLFETSRMVTVQGPGGAGKTRIANKIGHIVAGDGARVFFVELASVRGDDDVLAAVAGTLGVGESDVGPGGRPRLAYSDLRARLADALTADTLVILDNCEHVVDAAARIASELIAAADGVRILATSRSPLRVSSEVVHQLPTLDVGEKGSAATDLFVARAHAIRPDVAIDLGEVAALCRALDGLPLAIELAAARVRTMTVGEISQRLTDRFALLSAGSRSSPLRHRTLHAVIEWSWELLDHAAQVALRRLCRFPGGFSREAAAELVGAGGFELDDVLDALVDQSLLHVVENGGVRYRMLETVREFGEEQIIAAGEEAQVNSAIARWARKFSEDVREPFENGRQAVALKAIATEADNLVWVLRRCMEPDPVHRPDAAELTVVTCFPVLAGYWAIRGLHAEVMMWGPRVVAALPAETPAAIAVMSDFERENRQATYILAAAHLLMSRHLRSLAVARTRVRRLLRPQLAILRPMDFASAIATSYHPLSALRLLVIARDSPNPRVQMLAAVLRVNVRENVGDRAGAMRDAVENLALTEERNDLWMAAASRMEIGSLHGQVGDFDAALESYFKAIHLLNEIGSEQDSMQARGYVVAALIGSGRIDDARAEFADLSDGWQPSDPDPQLHPEVSAGILIAAAELEVYDHRTTSAANLYERAVRLLLREHPMPAQDPFVAMIISTAVCGMAVNGAVDRATPYLADLAKIIDHMVGPSGMGDLPQMGSVALGYGVLTCLRRPGSPDGVRLLHLAVRLGGRRDFPTLASAMDRRFEMSGVCDDEWRSGEAAVSTMSRRQAVRDIVDIIKRLNV